MIKLKFKILTKPWTLRLYTQKQYEAKHGDDSLGTTWGYKRTIDLYPSANAHESLIHELTHAYIRECCITGVEMDAHAFEEFTCELIAKHGRAILEQADELLQRLVNA